jgi:hypothetical protein
VLFDLSMTVGCSTADECSFQSDSSHEISHISGFRPVMKPCEIEFCRKVFKFVLNACSDGLSGLGSEFRPRS